MARAKSRQLSSRQKAQKEKRESRGRKVSVVVADDHVDTTDADETGVEERAERDASLGPSDVWVELFDTISGNNYWHNTVTDESTWTKPERQSSI